jgi:hypothetical protein
MHPRLRSLAALVLSLGLALPSHIVLAADGGEVERTLAIVELRAGPDPNSQNADYLKEVEASFKEENSGDYILVTGDKVVEKLRRDRDQVPGALTDERRTQLAEARKKGIDYLDNADAANAIKALTAAEAKYRAALAAPGADDLLRKQYLDVLAQLATAYVVAKDRDAAAEVFRTVITTFGLKAPITDDNYRPDVVELFKTIVKEVQKLNKGSLEVASTPPGARIVLGGNDRGATPATVPDLVPGVYSLRLQQGTATSLLHRVKIGGGSTAKIAIDVPFESHLILEDKAVGLSYPTLDDATRRVQADAVELGRNLEVNMVAVVGVMDGKLVSFLVDVSGNKIVRNSAVKVPQVGISKRAVVKVMATILGEKADKGGDVATPGPTGATPWYTSVPGWAAAGVGVIGVGVGALFAGSFQLKDGTTVSTFGDVGVPNAADLKEAEDTRGSRQVIAGAGLGLGVAALVASGVLFYLHGKSSPEGTSSLTLPRTDGLAFTLPPLGFGSAPLTFVGQ